MDSTSPITGSTIMSSSSSISSGKQSNTEIVEIPMQPSILLASPTVTPSSSPTSPPSTTAIDADYITAVGLCGVNGYETEVNHTIGLCREGRTDFNLLLTVAKCHTHSFNVRQKNRLMYACLTGNAGWFDTLFGMTSLLDIIRIRTRKNESLYHLVCTLPFTGPTLITWDIYNTDANPRNKVQDRIQILNTLLTTNIDIHVKTNTTKKQTAFDIVADDSELEGFVNAVNADEIELIRWWLDHIDRLDIEHHNRYLPWLAYDNRLEAVQRLCRMENTDLNIRTKFKETALTLASRNGHLSIVDELLTYYPHRLTATDLNHQNDDGDTAFFLACGYDHLDTVRSLCRVVDVDLDIPTQQGNTSLMIAAKNGHRVIVDELLTYFRLTAANINHQNKYGHTALYEACSNDHLDILRTLCRIPAIDLNIPNQYGDTALTIASCNGHSSIVDELLTYYPYRLTATDLNHRKKNGNTALYLACDNNHLDIVRSLCCLPAMDLNIPNGSGTTALMVAAQVGNASIVDELLTFYPHRLTATDLNHQNKFGYTALSAACYNNHLDIVKSLCHLQDVDMNLPTQHGNTAIMLAAYQGHASIVDELLTYYSNRLTNLDHQAKDDNTALSLACTHNHLDIVRNLCRIPTVNLNIPNEDCAIALILAADQGHTAIVDELLTYYPHRITATHLNHRNKKGNTALSIACRHGNTQIMEALQKHGALD